MEGKIKRYKIGLFFKRIFLLMVGIPALIVILVMLIDFNWREQEIWETIPYIIFGIGLMSFGIGSLSYHVRKGALFTWSKGESEVVENKFEKSLTWTGYTLMVLVIVFWVITGF
jgi:hypothetical protein